MDRKQGILRKIAEHFSIRRGRVVVAGTFDRLHPGHRDYFRQARAYGKELVAIVARDETVRNVKGKSPVQDEQERVAAVEADPLVDRAVLGNAGGDRFAILQSLKPTVVVLGYDQAVDEQQLSSRLREMGLGDTRVVRVKPYYPEQYKSSRM